MADKIVAHHKVNLSVQADPYNTGTEQIYRGSDSFDDNTSLFNKFAERAIALDKQLGPKNSDQLQNALEFKKIRKEDKERFELMNKEF